MENTFIPLANCQETNFNSSFSQCIGSGMQVPAYAADQNQFLPVFMLQPIFHQLFHRISSIETTLQSLTLELEEQKRGGNPTSGLATSAEFQEENSQNSRRTPEMSKEFTKHICCPVGGCRRRYSSKIAMRAHVRKVHREMILN